MRQSLTLLATVAILIGLVAAPAALAKASVDRAEEFVTVVPVALADNPAGVELMYADCDFVQRVENPDGSSVETQHCQLTDPFDHFPGTPPERAFIWTAGSCIWFSDYFQQTTGDVLAADSVRLTVTPSGNVNLTATYPPAPTPISEC
jgi:hypothetical protein